MQTIKKEEINLIPGKLYKILLGNENALSLCRRKQLKRKTVWFGIYIEKIKSGQFILNKFLIENKFYRIYDKEIICEL